MPLPEYPFQIHGGCNCKAVRYEVSVPPYSDRVQAPYRSLNKDVGDHRIPAVFIDHCNSCRRATSAILPSVLVCETRTVRLSLLPRHMQTTGAFQVEDGEREWKAGSEVLFAQNPILEESYLSCYNSSPGRNRWFCSRCGTMFAYNWGEGVIPKEYGWPVMVDIWQGTVDREDLEKDYMSPERMFWCEMGVPWIRRLATSGAGGIPEHPLTKLDKVVGDDIEEDLKLVAAKDPTTGRIKM